MIQIAPGELRYLAKFDPDYYTMQNLDFLLYDLVIKDWEIFYLCANCSRSSTDRIMVSGTIDMSSNLVGSTQAGKDEIPSLPASFFKNSCLSNGTHLALSVNLN